MGAIASGGVRVLNPDVIRRLGIPDEMIEVVTEREERELERRERTYHPGRAFCPVRGRTVILVDDGVATGATMRAAIEALRLQHPATVIVATPVASPDAAEMLREAADGFVCVHLPPSLDGVGRWYDDFTPTSDHEVRTLLAAGAVPSGTWQRAAGGAGLA
jgi:predicted phosphoribosyltransferase